MRAVYILCAGLVLAFGPVSASMTDEQQERLLQSLITMGEAPLAEESWELCEHVMREELDSTGRAAVIEKFFASRAFTMHHAHNFEAHLLYSTADKEKMARFIGAFSAGALQSAWQQPETAPSDPSVALLFLESAFNTSTEAVKTAIATGLHDMLARNPLQLMPALTIGTPLSAESVSHAMQTCITLGVYAGEKDIAEWLEAPRTTAEFQKATRVWLFDGGILGPEHLSGLETLFTATPTALHGVVVLHFPEITGFNANAAPLRVPGLSLDIPVVDPELMRDLSLYPPGLGIPPIPEFTAMALERLATAVQTTQFALRPDLQQRVRAFFTSQDLRFSPAMAAFFPPDVVHGTPEAQMAYLGFMWLANSQELLEAGLMLAEQQDRAPLFALLLVADVFSGNSDTTLLLRTSPAGMIFGSQTALRRVALTPDIVYVNGIAVGGRLWQYEMGDLAGQALLQP